MVYTINEIMADIVREILLNVQLITAQKTEKPTTVAKRFVNP